jgi:hypothetical protein
MAPPARKLIFPILDKKAVLLKGPIVYISEDHYISQVESKDLGIIVSRCPQSLHEFVGRSFRCIYYNHNTLDAQLPDVAEKERNALEMALNNFADRGKLLLPIAIAMGTPKAPRNISFHPQQITRWHHFASDHDYRFSAQYKPGELRAFLDVIRRASYKSPRAAASLRWYNSSVARDRVEDAIIDLCVALETLTEETTELSFRLSLFLAHAVGEPEKRQLAFKHFRSLYDVRSKIVHGAAHDAKFSSKLQDFQTHFGHTWNG